ncbi:hypothetical protein [Maricaulis sp.]|uniref:hypothetical protein n=1 Tax=unclassified Maricaulis TaxID=2632371 RepID=UPI001B1EEDC1|nr:hypothetical protein [Maricaulis sp.]MBO6795864.1 hypothetical protein [Maricaulis sp.]
MSKLSIAVVDDDPVELVLLTEIASDVCADAELNGFTRVEDFLEVDVNAFSLVLLDRRIPPHNDYSETLPMLAAAGFTNRVVLMTAHDPGLEIGDYPFEVGGPVDKLDLLKTEVLKAVFDDQPLPVNWSVRS